MSVFSKAASLASAVLAPAGLRIERIKRTPAYNEPFPEATNAERDLMGRFSSFTMTSRERQWTLLRTLDYIDAALIPGDIVECGVWRGGNMMMAKAARAGRSIARQIFLYDTFSGMSDSSDVDVDCSGAVASDIFDDVRCEASLDDVRSNFAFHGLAGPDVSFIRGKVEDTLLLAENLPTQIALLRIDTDWYESTKVELEVLYPRLSAGGVLIIDDYGHWLGARKAVDEYFKDRPVLLTPVDYTCRIAVKR